MANEPVGVEALEADILERAGIEKRDDLPITIDATWGANPDGSPRVFTTGEPHPLISGHLIFAIFQTPTEIKVYSLCPQNSVEMSPPKDAKEAREQMRTNPTRVTLVKTSRCSMTEIMILDVFVASIAQDLIMLELETYGEPPPDGEDEKKDPPKEPGSPGIKPQATLQQTGS